MKIFNRPFVYRMNVIENKTCHNLTKKHRKLHLFQLRGACDLGPNGPVPSIMIFERPFRSYDGH